MSARAVAVVVALAACKDDAPAASDRDAGGTIVGFGDGKKNE